MVLQPHLHLVENPLDSDLFRDRPVRYFVHSTWPTWDGLVAHRLAFAGHEEVQVFEHLSSSRAGR